MVGILNILYLLPSPGLVVLESQIIVRPPLKMVHMAILGVRQDQSRL